jgi:hypothetical protein
MSTPAFGSTQPHIQLVLEVISGVKERGREADHAPPSSVKVKNDGPIPPLPIHLYGTVFN